MIDSQHQEPESFEGHTAMGLPLSIKTAYKRWELTAKRATVIDTVAPLRPLRSPYVWGCVLATLAGVGLLVQGELLTGALALLGFGLLGLPLSCFGASAYPQLRLTREGVALQRSARRRRPSHWTLPWDGFDVVRVDASRRPISLEVNEHGQEALRGTRAKLDGVALRLPRLATPSCTRPTLAGRSTCHLRLAVRRGSTTPPARQALTRSPRPRQSQAARSSRPGTPSGTPSSSTTGR
ncbi:hypothetical protein [Nesterenkonia pannonica]|uniref:hypothetical protein n=1 Tax=Nesterenkonia pannonica TaxID=1548602 RepID=UPI0021640E88|nr:hypothetical protein [Nesterenkonia pannonica]